MIGVSSRATRSPLTVLSGSYFIASALVFVMGSHRPLDTVITIPTAYIGYNLPFPFLFTLSFPVELGPSINRPVLQCSIS
jgi:hypothetical protein